MSRYMLALLGVLVLGSCLIDFEQFEVEQFAATVTSGPGPGGAGGGDGGCAFCPVGPGGGGTGGTSVTTGPGAGGNGGQGGEGGCVSATQCPGTDTDCNKRDCDAGMCGFEASPFGDACDDMGGDLCDGAGDCIACAIAQTPPGGSCPAECTSCNGSECIKTCVDTAGVPDPTCAAFTCPAGFDCHITCTGLNACMNAVFTCPAQYECLLECSGVSACELADLDCSTGICRQTCSADTDVCKNGDVECGNNECTIECTNNSNIQLHVNQSCDATKPGC